MKPGDRVIVHDAGLKALREAYTKAAGSKAPDNHIGIVSYDEWDEPGTVLVEFPDGQAAPFNLDVVKVLSTVDGSRSEIAAVVDAELALEAAIAEDTKAAIALIRRRGLVHVDPGTPVGRQLNEMVDDLVKAATTRAPEIVLYDHAWTYVEAVTMARSHYTTMLHHQEVGEKYLIEEVCPVCKGNQTVWREEKTTQGMEQVERLCRDCKGKGRLPLDATAARTVREAVLGATKAWQACQRAAALALQGLGIGEIPKKKEEELTSYESVRRDLEARGLTDAPEAPAPVATEALEPLTVRVPEPNQMADLLKPEGATTT